MTALKLLQVGDIQLHGWLCPLSDSFSVPPFYTAHCSHLHLRLESKSGSENRLFSLGFCIHFSFSESSISNSFRQATSFGKFGRSCCQTGRPMPHPHGRFLLHSSFHNWYLT